MKKIMIVDDDKDMTKMLGDLMSLAGFEPTLVNESNQAMDVANTVNPDLFILDLMMPEPNGFELCRMFRSDSNFSEKPILIITAMDNGDSKGIAFAAGANDYVSKPFEPDMLTARIKKLLGKPKK